MMTFFNPAEQKKNMKKGTEILQFMNAMHTCSAIKKHFQHEYIFFLGCFQEELFFLSE